MKPFKVGDLVTPIVATHVLIPGNAFVVYKNAWDEIWAVRPNEKDPRILRSLDLFNHITTIRNEKKMARDN